MPSNASSIKLTSRAPRLNCRCQGEIASMPAAQRAARRLRSRRKAAAYSAGMLSAPKTAAGKRTANGVKPKAATEGTVA